MLLLSMTVSIAAAGEACTYNEAILALNKGNQVRAMALMRMAARDGDIRAENFLGFNDKSAVMMLATGKEQPEPVKSHSSIAVR